MDETTSLFVNASRFASQKGLSRFTRYLDPAQAHEAAIVAREYGVSFAAWGGYERAERVIGCFFPKGEEVSNDEYPLVCLSARIATKFCHMTHRDLLGAFMGLGLTRDCIGDIIIVSDRVYLFALEQTADFIVSSMTSAGKASLSFEILDQLPVLPEPSGTSFSQTVSSLRLDALLAAAYHLSRSEAATLIKAGGVKVNHLVEERTDFLVSEDSLLSVKGRGRVRFVRINGTTKKQRIGVTFFRYE